MNLRRQKTLFILSLLMVGIFTFSSCKKTTTTTNSITSTTCPQDGMFKATGFSSCTVTATNMAGIYMLITIQSGSTLTSNFKQMLFTVPIPSAVGEIQLGGSSFSSWAATYGEGSTMYNTDETNTGVFNVTSLDLTAKKMSGTFSFTGVSKPSGNLKSITNGTFTNVTW